MNRVTLREILSDYFDLDELQTRCFDLSIDYQSLGGEGKQAKAREIVAHCERNDRTRELAAAVRRLRKNIDFRAIAEPSLQKQSILYVDDEPWFIQSLIEGLEDAGFDIILATDVSQALSILRSSQRIDLIVTDLIIPHGDKEYDEAPVSRDETPVWGLKVIEDARKLRGDIPILCVSVVESEGVSKRLQELDVVKYLEKPILPNELEEQVKAILWPPFDPSKQELISHEIKRRKLELKSDSADIRIRAVWALGELGHHDPTIVSSLHSIAEKDKDSGVKTAARKAISKIQKSHKR